MNDPNVESVDLKCSMISGTAGAAIDEARGVRKVRTEMILQLIHFLLLVQLIGLRGSASSFHVTMLPDVTETTRSIPADFSSTATSVVLTTGMPFSMSGSVMADVLSDSCLDDGRLDVAIVSLPIDDGIFS